MVPPPTISVSQLTTMIDFLEAHPDLALGRCARTKEGRSLSKRLWVELSGTLNSLSADCATKSGDQWRVYYNEYKSKILKKIKNEKNERSATGGGQAQIINLTPLQDRLYNILGRDVGEPLPGVRHVPLIIEQDGVPGGSADSDLIFGDTMNTEEVQIEYIVSPPPDLPNVGDPPEPDQYLKEIQEKEKEETDKFKSKKQKQKKKKIQKENIDDSEHEPSMREAAASLQRMEQMNSDAMLVTAAAVNRLAGAVEMLARSVASAASVPTRRGRRSLTEDSERLAEPSPPAGMPGSRSSSPARKRARRLRIPSSSSSSSN